MADLIIDTSEKRSIDNIIIQGCPEFPKSFISHYLGIKQQTLFNLETTEKLSFLLSSIPFVSQIKEPAVLFTKDSTSLYLYVKKKNTSKFDGIIGFANNEDTGKLMFSGYLDLELNNLFDKGERIGLNWKNSGDENQTLDLNFYTPYI